MKVYYVLIGLFVLILFCSCSRQKTKESKSIVLYDTVLKSKQIINKKDNTDINIDSIKKKILTSAISFPDTVKYQFSLEDVGTEGNEGTAYYLNDSIRKVEMNIYTSMWKINLHYLFNNIHIKVAERTYNIYDKRIKLVKEISYAINLNGIPLEKADTTRVDVFQELKSAIPFMLK